MMPEGNMFWFKSYFVMLGCHAQCKFPTFKAWFTASNDNSSKNLSKTSTRQDGCSRLTLATVFVSLIITGIDYTYAFISNPCNSVRLCLYHNEQRTIQHQKCNLLLSEPAVFSALNISTRNQLSHTPYSKSLEITVPHRSPCFPQ